MSKVIRWKVDKKTELKFRWDRGAAFDLSSEGFDGPDSDRFDAFVTTFLWACCQNRGKATPKQLVLLIFKGTDEDEEQEATLQQEMQETFIEVLKHSPWKEVAIQLESFLEDAEGANDDVVIGGEEEKPGKPELSSTEPDSSENGPDSEEPAG